MELFSAPFRWDRYLAQARVLLGVSALANELQAAYPQYPDTLLSVAIGVFLLYSVVVAARKRGHTGVFGLLALFGDTIFFLILANRGTGHSMWFPSVFFLYVVAEALAFFSPREVFIVVVISSLFCAIAPAPVVNVSMPHLRLVLRVVLAAGTLAVAFSIKKDRLEKRIRELTRDAVDAQEAARKATEAERQRIASDFHDGALQSFISLQMRLEILRKLLERDVNAGMADLQQLQTLALSQVQQLRAFVRSMRPVDVDGANLFAAGRRIAENFQKESGIPVTFVGGDKPLAMAQETSSEVLQMLREALHNVQKHAGATRVAVSMEKTDKTLEISIDDNGRGFPFSGTYTLEELELLRLGPVSLKKRARSLNADMMLDTKPGRGAGLKVRIPL